MGLQLLVKSGPQAGQRIDLSNEPAITVGRVNCSAVFPEDVGMSRLHFEVRCNGEKTGLKNHSQTNGTWVNGERCEFILLQPGDTIMAGATMFTLLPSFNGWTFADLSPMWEVLPDQGLRYARTEENITTVIVSEDNLPPGYDLPAYLKIQLTLIAERLPQSSVLHFEGETPGADAAAGLEIWTGMPDGRIIRQKQLYAALGRRVGILTATVFQAEPPEVHIAVDQLFSTATYTAEN